MSPATAAIIRRAETGDFEAVLRLTCATARASYGPFLGMDAVEAYLDSGEAERYLTERLTDGWVIALDGRVVGIAIAEDHVIGQLVIDHRNHRRGLGSRLLAHVEARLAERYEVLELESFEANSMANHFYRAHGWTEAERRLDAEHGNSMIVFRKDSPRGR